MKVAPEHSTQAQVFSAIACLLFFTLSFMACSGSSSNDSNANASGKRSISALIRGINGDGTDTSPIADATCRLVDFNGDAIMDIDQFPLEVTTDQDGAFLFENVPVDVEGFILCSPPGLPLLTLSSFTSTVGVIEDQTVFEEEVLPQTTAVANIVHEIDETGQASDLRAVEAKLLRDAFNAPSSNVAELAEGAMVLYDQMYHQRVEGIRFSSFRDADLYGALEDLTAHDGLADDRWSGGELKAVKDLVEDEVNRRGLELFQASTTGDVRAQVTNIYGYLLRQEDVIILQPGEPTLQIVTDADARFALNNIPAKQTGIFVLNRLAAEIRIVGGASYDLGVLRVDANSDAAGNISGQVLDARGDPAAGIREVYARQDDQIVAYVETDAQGNFVINNVPVGETEVYAQGMTPTIETVVVLEGLTFSGVHPKVDIDILY